MAAQHSGKKFNFILINRRRVIGIRNRISMRMCQVEMETNRLFIILFSAYRVINKSKAISVYRLASRQMKRNFRVFCFIQTNAMRSVSK